MAITVRPYLFSDRYEVERFLRENLDLVERIVSAWEPAYIAEDNGIIVGFVSASLVDGKAFGENFAIEKAYRGTPAYYRLIMALENDLCSRGILIYCGTIGKRNAYHLRVATKWGARIVGENEKEYFLEVNLLTRKGAKPRRPAHV